MDMTQGLADITKEMNQVKARLARRGKRFEMMHDVVQRDIDQTPRRLEVDELRARVERKSDSAA